MKKKKTLQISKKIKPFWNSEVANISKILWIPKKENQTNNPTNLKTTALKNTWFHVDFFNPSSNYISPTFKLNNYINADETNKTITKIKKIQLNTDKQSNKFYHACKRGFRKSYNRTLDFLIKSYINFPEWYTKAWFIDERPVLLSPYDFSNIEMHKILFNNEAFYLESFPAQIRYLAVAQAVKKFITIPKKIVNNQKFINEPKSPYKNKRNPNQTFYIHNQTINKKGKLYPSKINNFKTWRSLPEKVLDSNITWQYDKWFLNAVYKQDINLPERKLTKIVAIDPGVRTFATFYTPEVAGFIGKNDITIIFKMLRELDSILSQKQFKINKLKKAKEEKQTKKIISKLYFKTKKLNKASIRLKFRINNKIDELHKKAARFLVDNFDIILLPTFEVSEMVKKEKRKLTTKTTRRMLTYSHYKFKMHLKNKAAETGKIVIDVDEAYTSKTHPQTGEIKNIGGAKEIKLLDGTKVDRDIVGARNIFMKNVIELNKIQPQTTNRKTI